MTNAPTPAAAKIHQAYRSTVLVALQPVVHKIMRQRYGNGQGNRNQHYKLPRKELPQIEYGSTEHFPDADLFGTLLCHKRSHPKQAKATDKNRQHSKETCQLTYTFFIGKFASIFFINKFVIDGEAGAYFLKTDSIAINASLVLLPGLMRIVITSLLIAHGCKDCLFHWSS